MRRRARRREQEAFGLSFLDAICCGFGAIVLLLVITKTAEPTIVQTRGTGLAALAQALSERLPELDVQAESLADKLAARQELLARLRRELAKLEAETSARKRERAAAELEARTAATVERSLAAAKQELTAEMRRLYARGVRSQKSTVGGIPVDSEYIVFVIDTSGSMHRYAWRAMIRTLRETLDVYPKVKGVQIMNDMGDYMFGEYSGRWIPDTPGRRRAILQRLSTWQPFSNSSPVEGITRAIRALAAPDKRISIYVFGDEFTGGSIQSVLDTVARINPPDANGQRRARIHAVGFPVQFTGGNARTTGVRFATLMRRLCDENGGTFVALRSVSE